MEWREGGRRENNGLSNARSGPGRANDARLIIMGVTTTIVAPLRYVTSRDLRHVIITSRNPGVLTANTPQSIPTLPADSFHCTLRETCRHFYRAMHYSAKRGIAIACRPSVRPSVCLSVRL